jgi:hypothetical protein
MRFLSVMATAFGPFRGVTLDLAPGMTVVYGPNEAGKSTWHAALYAGLCGIRRAKGRARSEDERFAERHRPWTGDGWAVRVRIHLEDGRDIELQHDLAGLVDCRAVDVGLGRDVSAEIINDGSPDGARWLGLDRGAFLATSCVRQADLLGILGNPKLLQEHLQRAADTGGRDETAAAALAEIDEFHREHVGLDRANSTRPLYQAKLRLAAAREKVELARYRHSSFLELEAALRAADAEAADRAVELRRIEAARAVRDAETARRPLERAKEIIANYPERPPAQKLDDPLAEEVRSAISEWTAAPSVPVLSGETADDIRQEILALPAVPEGDIVPHPSVMEAAAALGDARRKIELHATGRPVVPAPPRCGGLSADTLRDIAHGLSVPAPPADTETRARADTAAQQLVVAQRRRRIALIAALTAFVATALASIDGMRGTCVAVLGAAACALAGAATVFYRTERARDLEHREASLAADAATRTIVAWRDGVEASRRRALDQGVEPNADRFRVLASELDTARVATEALAQWESEDSRLRELASTAAGQLRQALICRGAPLDPDPEVAHAAYVTACAEREQLDALAARRVDLESRLAAREAAEGLARDARTVREGARNALRAAVAHCNLVLDVDDEDSLVLALRRWHEDHQAERALQECALMEWSELEGILQGRSIDELEAEVGQARATADGLVRAAGVEECALPALERDTEGQVRRLLELDKAALRRADELRGRLKNEARRLESVTEAEEAATQADEELARVEQLGRTLELTRSFLERAQERVHRDVAKVLADAIRGWLPRLTGDRYDDVSVDPESLGVKVRGASFGWRSAALLSHGTSEQVYLLLRVALATHLTRAGEVCPLVLDDVTTQSDRERSLAILALLHEVSRERQVILFTQEDDVLAWAEENFRDPSDRLVLLDPRLVAT